MKCWILDHEDLKIVHVSEDKVTEQDVRSIFPEYKTCRIYELKAGGTSQNTLIVQEAKINEATPPPDDIDPAFKSRIEQSVAFATAHAGDNGGEWLEQMNGEEVSLNTPYTSEACDTNKFTLVVEHFDDDTDENWNEVFEAEVHVTLKRTQERKPS